MLDGACDVEKLCHRVKELWFDRGLQFGAIESGIGIQHAANGAGIGAGMV